MNKDVPTDRLFEHLARTPDPELAQALEQDPDAAAEARRLSAMIQGMREMQPPAMDRKAQAAMMDSVLGPAPARSRWWHGVWVAGLALALVLVGLWRAPADPQRLELRVVDARGAVLFRLEGLGRVNADAEPLRIELGEALSFTLEPGAAVQVLAVKPLHTELRLEQGELSWELGPDQGVIVLTPAKELRLEPGEGRASLRGKALRVGVTRGSARYGESLRVAAGALVADDGAGPETRPWSGHAADLWLETVPDPIPPPEPAPAPKVAPAPPSPAALYAQAEAALREGDTPAAIRLFAVLADTHPSSPEGRLALLEGGRLLEDVDPRAAAEAYRRYLALGKSPEAPLHAQAQEALCRLEPEQCPP